MINYALEFFAICMLFIYQTVILKYAVQVLVKGTNSILAIYFWSIFNCIIFVLFLYLGIPFYLFYPGIALVLGIEFKIISKASWVQVFCGSSIFAMHIAAVNIVVISIFSFVLKIPPIDIYMKGDSQLVVLFITCFALALFIQPIVEKFFEPMQIQRITTLPTYSVMLLISILGTVLYESLFILLVLENSFYPEQLLLSLGSSIFVLGGFYFLFIYGISLTSASFYKRKTDETYSEKAHIENTKALLNEKIEKDYLTGVHSRKYAFSLLEDLVELEYTPFTVLFVDVNALKFTNDAYGHESGDRLIIKVSEALTDSVREGDVVARLGGDEFIVILENSSEDTTEGILCRFEETIENKNKEEEFSISASVGVVFVNEELKAKGVDYILHLADTSMRKEKARFYEEEGRNK